MGEDRGSREEPEGERGQGHGWGGQGGGGEDGGDRQAAGRGGAGSGGAAVGVGGPSEKGGEGGGGRHEEGVGPKGRPPLMPFRQPAVPPEEESEMQERPWRQIRGEAERLAEGDRVVAARERRVREEEETVAREAHRVLPDLEGNTPSTDVEGRSPSGRRAREEEEQAGEGEGEAAPGGGAGSRGSRGGAAASEPQRRADTDRLGLGVARVAAVCAAAGTEGARDGRGMDSGGTWRTWSAT